MNTIEFFNNLRTERRNIRYRGVHDESEAVVWVAKLYSYIMRLYLEFFGSVNLFFN